MKKLNLPNLLTVLRVALIPFFVFFYYAAFVPGHHWIALAIFVIACVTDLLDGKIARKYNLVTTFGKFMDPLADKILVITALILFTEDGSLPGVALVIICAREFIVSGLRVIAADKGTVIAAGLLGKTKTVIQMIMSISLMVPFPWKWYFIYEQVVIWLAVFFTVISLVDYFIKNKGILEDK